MDLLSRLGPHWGTGRTIWGTQVGYIPKVGYPLKFSLLGALPRRWRVFLPANKKVLWSQVPVPSLDSACGFCRHRVQEALAAGLPASTLSGLKMIGCLEGKWRAQANAWFFLKIFCGGGFSGLPHPQRLSFLFGLLARPTRKGYWLIKFIKLPLGNFGQEKNYFIFFLGGLLRGSSKIRRRLIRSPRCR